MIPAVQTPSPSALAAPLLAWYDLEGRTLPWRGISNLYAILVSELMLQQTRVDTVLRYFDRFMERFPTVEALASASQEEVMAEWSGLGFYRRARNLHRAAQCIVADYGGRVPEDPQALQDLPGIGRYTAGAILSSGRNAKLPILDGNVIRVLTRVYSIGEAPDRAATQRRLWKLAEDILPDVRPGDFNQAIMDLGATLCRHQNPSCIRCPFQDICTAAASGSSEDFPRPGRATRVKQVDRVAVLLLGEDGRFRLNRRPEDGLLASLWELPSAEVPDGELAVIQAAAISSGAELQFCGTVEHRFSHRHWVIQVFRGTDKVLEAEPEPISATTQVRANLPELEELGIPTVTRKTIDCAMAAT